MNRLVKLSLCGCILLSANLWSEAYRWVDAQGNVHFGDRPPDKNLADDISEKISNQNIDASSTNTRETLEQHDRRTSAEQVEHQQFSESDKADLERRNNACREARRQLKILKGRVIFYDDKGKEIKVTEKEREAKARAFEREVKQYCS